MGVADMLWREGIVAEERARLDQYQRAWDAYFGNHPRPFVIKPGQADDNVVVNLARAIVDTGVAFLFGQEPEFDLDQNSRQRSPAEQRLDDLWRANRKMIFLQKLATNGGVCGHAFVKIQPPTVAGGFPRFLNISPEYVRVTVDPDDIDLVWRYVIEYPAMGKDGEKLLRRQRVERDDAGRWAVVDETSENGGAWRMEREPFVWPWNWAPVIDAQNLPSPNEVYGMADIETDVLQLNHAVNFALSNLQRIIRYHAHPKTIARGVSAREIRVDADGIISIPHMDGDIHNLEMQSDLSSSIEYYKKLREALHQVAQVPEVATGKLEGIGALSGTALEIMYQPLIRRTEQKRLTYGEMLTELNRRALEMMGYGPDQITAITWPEVLPKNALEERQALILDQQLGASQDSLLQRAGYDPDHEREAREGDGATMAATMLDAFSDGDEE